MAKVVSAARAIVTYQVGLPVGCLRVSRALFWLQPHEAVNEPVFDEYFEATRELPLGTERLYCSRDALRRFDVALEAANIRFRDQIFEACYRLLDRFGVTTDAGDGE